MELEAVLKEIGLTNGETKVYLALIKLGFSPVNKIKEESNLHRTAIYDFIERLINKGLVTYVIKKNIRYYNAAEPIKLIDFLKEKERKVNEILPVLTKLSNFNKDDVKVEVYEGKEGVKFVFNDVIRNNKELLAFGVDEERFDKLLGTFMEQYLRRLKEAKLNERLITYVGAKFIYKNKTTFYRYIPLEYFNPVTTYIYANKIAILIWEPLMIVMIENRSLYDNYKKHFEMMWVIAKKNKKK